jgi:hypothetical protein
VFERDCVLLVLDGFARRAATFPSRVANLALPFDFFDLIVVAATAEPERLIVVAATNTVGSAAGATRKAAARNGTVRSGIKNLRDMKFLPGSRLYIGLIPYRTTTYDP